MGVASRGRHQPHVHPHTTNMGAKLSKKTELKEQTEDVQEAVADKSSTLPPPATEAEPAIEKTQEEEEEVVTKAETLPRKAFDRSSNFRKSMRKLVGKRKSKDEEKVEKPVEENSAEKTATEEENKEEDFKTAQQKARADFFKDMVPEKDGVEEKEDDTVEDKVEEERVSINVSLIGTPVAEEEEKE